MKILSVRTVQEMAFSHCNELNDVEFGSALGTIGNRMFLSCHSLRRIAIPLKDNLFPLNTIRRPFGNERRCTQFDQCFSLRTVDIVGAEEINKTISSLLLDSWRDEMKEEINRINRELPIDADNERTDAIRLWVSSVIDMLGRFKAEHNTLLKEHMTQLELAVWKAKLDEKEEDSSNQEVEAKRVKIEVSSMRKEKRITSGADIIIKNVVPFLKLAEMGM